MRSAVFGWVCERVAQLLSGVERPVVAVLGLADEPDAGSLLDAPAVELCRWLHDREVRVRGHDPAVYRLPGGLHRLLDLAGGPLEALDGAHLAVVATAWPGYRGLRAPDVNARMRRPLVLDPHHFLADVLGNDPRIHYVAPGRCAA
jgi:UDP-glucose 6-dehydrogenase